MWSFIVFRSGITSSLWTFRYMIYDSACLPHMSDPHSSARNLPICLMRSRIRHKRYVIDEDHYIIDYVMFLLPKYGDRCIGWEYGAPVRKVSDPNPYASSTKMKFWKFSDLDSPMVILAPRGAKITIGESRSENFLTGAPLLRTMTRRSCLHAAALCLGHNWKQYDVDGYAETLICIKQDRPWANTPGLVSTFLLLC